MKRELPKYLQLKKEILTWLHAGQFKAGDQMLSENEIAARFQLSRQTVRQAFGELEQEGWLTRVQGKGTFVSLPRAQPGQELLSIGMITTYISDYIFPHIVRGTEAALRGHGYRLMLMSTDNEKEKERESIQMLLEQPLSGLIIEPTKSAQGNPNLSDYLSLEYQRIPVVMLHERYPELSFPCVKLDDEAGGYIAAEHLIRLGHRKIVGFFKTDDMQGVNRLKGFIRAHHAHRIPLPPEAIVQYDTEEKLRKPYELASRMLQQSDRPTAFVAYNDELAIQLLEAARQGGLSIPDDLSIVGFDDSPLATATEVKLTTLTHPKMDMGVAAADMLIRMIHSGDAQSEQDLVFKPELMIRESTRRV